MLDLRVLGGSSQPAVSSLGCLSLHPNPRMLAAATAAAGAVVPFILLLSLLHFPLLHLPLVDVEGGEGEQNQAEDEGDQDN